MTTNEQSVAITTRRPDALIVDGRLVGVPDILLSDLYVS
jgi:hypothetical protein